MFDDKIKKYLALALLIISGIYILYLLRAYLTPIAAAIILTYLTFPIYNFFLRKTKKEVLSAFLVIVSLLFLFLIPISAMAGLLIGELSSFSIDSEKIESYEQSIEKLTGKEVSVAQSIDTIGKRISSNLRSYAKTFVSFTTSFLFSLFLMFFVMFYLLIEKDKFLNATYNFLPFSKKGSKHLLNESGKVTKAVLIGQVLTAIIQGLLGMFSFFVAGIDGAIFWGIIMIILSLIPVIGAFLIWLPAGLLLILEGSIGAGIFVLLWGAVVVSQIDNIIRPKLVNKFADIHPLETFLGIFMGLSAFGMIGIILGPLLFSLFKLFVITYKEDYGKNKLRS